MKTGPWLIPSLAIVVLLGYPAGMHWLLTASSWSHATLAWINLAQTVGMQTLLAWFFGRTLRAGHEPLIAQFARRIHGDGYSPPIARYARQATWAWTGFFIAMAVIPMILFFTAPLTIWSLFVNVLSIPLLGLMFVAEYAARRYCLRDIPHVSLMKSFTLYRDSRRATGERT
jgi:uncharacterized membrane protein